MTEVDDVPDGDDADDKDGDCHDQGDEDHQPRGVGRRVTCLILQFPLCCVRYIQSRGAEQIVLKSF